MKQGKKIINAALESQKLQAIDIGAKNGIFKLKNLDALAHYYGFEPNEKEYEKLIEQENIQYYPYFIGDKNEEKKFYITENSSYSSLLQFNPSMYDKHFHYNKAKETWKKGFSVKETNIVQAITLSKFINDHNIPFVDFIKLDTQGTELEILKGSINTLKEKK